MKRMQIASLVLGLLLGATGGVVNAQSVGAQAEASNTREQVKMDRDEFLKTHRWEGDNWVLKPGFEAPAGMKSRAEMKAERNEFLRNNRWEQATSSWVPLNAQPRDISTLTRAQMRAETAEFQRTYKWDEVTQTWVQKSPSKKK